MLSYRGSGLPILRPSLKKRRHGIGVPEHVAKAAIHLCLAALSRLGPLFGGPGGEPRGSPVSHGCPVCQPVWAAAPAWHRDGSRSRLPSREPTMTSSSSGHETSASPSPHTATSNGAGSRCPRIERRSPGTACEGRVVDQAFQGAYGRAHREIAGSPTPAAGQGVGGLRGGAAACPLVEGRPDRRVTERPQEAPANHATNDMPNIRLRMLLCRSRGLFRPKARPVSFGLHGSRFALRAWLLCGTR